MRVTRLTLSHFRNHPLAGVACDAPMVALIGDNGAGKTNVLEALSLLAPGRGLRGAALADMVRADGDGSFAVRVAVRPSPAHATHSADMSLPPDGRSDAGSGKGSDTPGDVVHTTDPVVASDMAPVAIATGVATGAPNRRLVRINGAEQAASALAEWLSILWLTPAMDRIFAEAASGRRRFLDRLTLALFPDHARHATRYDAAMRARTRLLTGETPPDPQWLSALEVQMADHGAAMIAARLHLVGAVMAQLDRAPADGFARPHLAIAATEAAHSSSAEALAAQFKQHRAVDAAAGRATSGPHRHDLIVTHAAHGQPADRCSTGEQKALLLSIIMAHGDCVAARRGHRPILLLDEIAAHLDPGRRAALFDRLHSSGGQVWMTGTEAALFSDLPDGALTCAVTPGAVIPTADIN